MADVMVLIENSSKKLLQPAVLDGVTWETTRKGAPGKLVFRVVKDTLLDFQEGNPVRMMVNGVNVFYGFVFTKRRNKDNVIEVTAYDQLRYLKNKDVFWYTNLTATEVVKRLAADFKLQIGELEDTGYVIPKYRGSNETLFDIVQTALDYTLQNNKTMYVLYDNVGKLMLKNMDNLHVPILLDTETAEDFDYESSIDKETYNKIKLYYDDKDEGKRKIFISQDSTNQGRWGILQLCESINPKKAINPASKADALLGLYNRVRRELTIKNAAGDNRVRAGTGILVNLDLGDVNIDNKWMLVESAKHTYSNNQHNMELTLRGGVIG